MTEQRTANAESSRPELIVDLFDVVAEHSAGHALRDLEQLVAGLRAGAEEAAGAREVLSQTQVEVLCQAPRLGAAGQTGLAR